MGVRGSRPVVTHIPPPRDNEGLGSSPCLAQTAKVLASPAPSSRCRPRRRCWNGLQGSARRCRGSPGLLLLREKQMGPKSPASAAWWRAPQDCYCFQKSRQGPSHLPQRFECLVPQQRLCGTNWDRTKQEPRFLYIFIPFFAGPLSKGVPETQESHPQFPTNCPAAVFCLFACLWGRGVFSRTRGKSRQRSQPLSCLPLSHVFSFFPMQVVEGLKGTTGALDQGPSCISSGPLDLAVINID